MGSVAAVPPNPGTAVALDVRAPTATVEPTLRQWAARTQGIVVDPVLVSRLDQALEGVDGRVGIAVKDLGSGRGAVLDGDLELPSASLYKLPVLYTVFAAGLNMYEELPITDDALAYDAGTMELGAGETLTVAEAVERMVTLSDNTSAIMLASRVGPSRINANIAALGMDTTHYGLERMTTSALDMLHLVELVADGNAVSPSASADMLHLLLRQRVNDRLPRLLPDDVQVAHKTGNLPGTVNDVGIVYGPASTVAISALVSDTSDETAAAAAIGRVSLVAYTYFEEQPEFQGTAESERPRVLPAPSRPVPPVWREPHPPTPTAEPSVEPEVVATPTLSVAVARPTPVRPPAPPPAAAPTAVAPPAQVAARATPAPTPKPTLAPPPPTATPLPPAPSPTPLPAPTKAATRPAATTPTTPSKH